MKGQQLDVVHGSGNVFRDLGHSNADVAQFKAILATEIEHRYSKNAMTIDSSVNIVRVFFRHKLAQMSGKYFIVSL